MLAKIIGNELGNKEGWSFSTKLTTLLYYLIHSLLPFLLPILYLIESFYYLIHFGMEKKNFLFFHAKMNQVIEGFN